MATLLLPAALLLAAPFQGPAPTANDGQDWPHWRGPDRNGVSAETNWSSTGKDEPLWRRDLGIGHSSFAIVGDRVYAMGFDAEAGMDRVYCLDADTGSSLWSHEYAAEIWDFGHDGGTLTTPTVVGDVVYTSNREGKVFCLDAGNGDVKWSRDLRKEHELEPHTWGFSASPLVVDDMVIMVVDHVIALDRETGKDLWKTETSYGISYSTPMPFEREGKKLLASLTGNGLGVLSREDGSELAFFEWVKKPQIYPMTPVVHGDLIFISAGYERGCAMLQFDGKSLTELWGGRMMRNKMSGCVLHEGHLYGFDESILTCLDLEGNRKWRVRGLGTGSMTIAGDRMIILDGKGQLIVAEANPEEYVELSKSQVFEDGTSWSTPVLSHGRIYCRSSKDGMACLDHRGADERVVASLSNTGEAKLPSAAEVIARHVAAVGDPAKVAALDDVHLSGDGESLRNTVDKSAVDVHMSRDGKFSWRDAAGFQVAHNGATAWVTGLRSGPGVLEDDDLAELLEAGSLTRILDPSSTYVDLGATRRGTFDNRACIAISAKTKGGAERTVWFDEATGLLAGHEGEGIWLWTLDAYEAIDGVLVPTRWAFYDDNTGERSAATFGERNTFDPKDTDAFELPEIIKMINRTPEEIEAANAELKKKHAAILGDWTSAEDDSQTATFSIGGGFVMFRAGERPPGRLTPAEDDGSMRILGAEYVRLFPVVDDDGSVAKIELYVGPELEDTMVRAEGDGSAR